MTNAPEQLMDVTRIPLDVWLKFGDDPIEEEAEAEANTFATGSGYVIEWYLNSVGLTKRVWFDTLEEVHAWYETNGFEDYSS